MKLQDKIGLTIIILGLIFLLVVPYYNWKNAGLMRYTIGKLLKMTISRNGYQPTYEYIVLGKKYNIERGGSRNILPGTEIDSMAGKYFYIIYRANNPSYAEILLDYPVPDSIQSAPLNGWDSIPGVGQLENPFVWHAGKSPPVKKK
ncbi:MAG: hypothetical protein IPM47_20485 [Sphingobacteriales bacterium]|nr:MAG: hypothetical protein IPM47_20485 [Sphingobacteriales bacterium]